MDTNKLKEEKEGIYIDENNGIKYIKQGEAYIPLVVKGLPAKLEEHNGQRYLVNNFGTYTIEDGKVSTKPLCNNEGILLFFNENGELGTSPKAVQGKILGLEELTGNVRTSQINKVEGEISTGYRSDVEEKNNNNQQDITERE